MRLIYNGKQLEDNLVLENTDLKDHSTIHIILRLSGGMFHEFSGRDGVYTPLSLLLDKVIDIKSSDEILDE